MPVLEKPFIFRLVLHMQRSPDLSRLWLPAERVTGCKGSAFQAVWNNIKSICGIGSGNWPIHTCQSALDTGTIKWRRRLCGPTVDQHVKCRWGGLEIAQEFPTPSNHYTVPAHKVDSFLVVSVIKGSWVPLLCSIIPMERIIAFMTHPSSFLWASCGPSLFTTL